MSYDTIKSRNRRSAIEWQLAEDNKRAEFLLALDAADFDLTEREGRLLYCFVSGSQWRWNETSRLACDDMRKKYGGRL